MNVDEVIDMVAELTTKTCIVCSEQVEHGTALCPQCWGVLDASAGEKIKHKDFLPVYVPDTDEEGRHVLAFLHRSALEYLRDFEMAERLKRLPCLVLSPETFEKFEAMIDDSLRRAEEGVYDA